MTAQQPPRPRSANQAANAKSNSDSRSATSTCPLMKSHVQLLPLRYGLIEGNAPADVVLPYALSARPLGIRLVRDGFLYIIDGDSEELYEYRLEQGAVTQLLWKGTEVDADERSVSVGAPQLIFPRHGTLHVAYFERQWTARKCQQVLGSAEDREHFMQRVELSAARAGSGAMHLLTRIQVETGLAELVPPPEPQALGEGALPQESQTYPWEPAQPRNLAMGDLTRAILPDYEQDSLFLVLRDDIGVMRDLAQFQDTVVGWIETWAEGGNQPGANERDYVLACYIESLSQVTEANFDRLSEQSASAEVQAMLAELQKLPPAERDATHQALITFLNHNEPYPRFGDHGHPLALQKELDNIRLAASHLGRAAYHVPMELAQATERFYTRQKLVALGAKPGFVDGQLDALVSLKKEQDARVRDQLNGAKLGQRGINDLIDRPAMDAFLALQRPNLERWSQLLDVITKDRVRLLTTGHFHRAAWFYDPEHGTQYAQALEAQHACLRDTCRSDEACEAVLDWIERNPQFDRLLFHTLPLSEQTTLAAQYSQLAAAGLPLGQGALDQLRELQTIEQGRFPALDQLPNATRALAESAQGTLNPALTLGISRAMDTFYQELGQQKVPELDELFRKLPKVLATRLLDAMQQDGVTFTSASEAEKAALLDDIRDTLSERATLGFLLRERKKVKSAAGHKSPRARELLLKIRQVRAQLEILERRLAAALSPIADLPDNSIRVAGAAPGRAGITLVLPPAQQQEVAGVLRNLRNGYDAAGNWSRLGDGIGLAVFVAQFVNLVQVVRELASQTQDKRTWWPFFNALFATGAAGFSAAQAIADTALRARSAQLAQGLQNHALDSVHAQMGKLHAGLGIVGYAFGILASAMSSRAHLAEWQSAIRSGNARAQQSAALALTGSSGMLASNAYGFALTLKTTRSALRDSRRANDLAARRTAWATAGTHLSRVFLRFNLVGALFTAVELSGTYFYNRSNTTPHDDWLLATPWSQDAALRQNHSLEIFQRHLFRVVHLPRVQVKHGSHGSWWRDLALPPASREITLALPGLSRAELAQPLTGRPALRLGLGAYRIRPVYYDRGPARLQWQPISELIVDGLQVADDEPLQIRVPSPTPLESFSAGGAPEELLLEIVIERLDQQGNYRPENFKIRFSAQREGDYPATQQNIQGQQAPVLLIDPLLLPETDNGKQ